jgi:hypothetical protein
VGVEGVALGVYQGQSIMRVLWWDPEYGVCPSQEFGKSWMHLAPPYGRRRSCAADGADILTPADPSDLAAALVTIDSWPSYTKVSKSPRGVR